jgi:Domain of unknown function (DUF4279)
MHVPAFRFIVPKLYGMHRGLEFPDGGGGMWACDLGTRRERGGDYGVGRFSLTYLVIHPDMDPAEIPLALGLATHMSRMKGVRQRTPRGTLSPSPSRDSRWNHVRRFSEDGVPSAALAELVSELCQHTQYIRRLVSSGAMQEISVAFCGGAAQHALVSEDTLRKMAALGIHLGVEIFPDC